MNTAGHVGWIRAGRIAWALAVALTAAAAAAMPPNILLIIADDATCSDLPLFGGRNLQTPEIDRLASEGVTFRRAFAGTSMCVPCRAELYTGLHPARNGVAWNHSFARPGTKSIVHRLGELGYRVGLAGKVHASPVPVFPFEMVEGFERNCVAATAAADPAGIREFMIRDPDRPFCLIVGLVVPHIPWTVGDPSKFDPARLELPPWLADTPATRASFSRYLAEMDVMDQQVGMILRTLDETGARDRTLAIFTSEQGGQWPGAKWTAWEAGMRTALIVRWPGRAAAGRSTDALVQYADVLPTLVEAAGGDPAAAGFDGRSFLGVLTGRTDRHRDYAYLMHNNVPEGSPYPIRSVHDGRFHYIRNLSPDRVYLEKHLMGTTNHDEPYWLSWIWAAETDARVYRLVERYLRRPAEELYDTSVDPWELDNLAGRPDHAGRLRAMSAELDRWMREQGDPGAALDTKEQLEANRAAGRPAAPRGAQRK